MDSTRKILSVAFAIALVLALIEPASRAQATPAALLIDLGGEKRQFSTAELLGNPATKTIEIARDVSYGRPMHYQAIPLLDLLRGLPTDTMHTLEARANDGFASQLPWSLIARGASGAPSPGSQSKTLRIHGRILEASPHLLGLFIWCGNIPSAPAFRRSSGPTRLQASLVAPIRCSGGRSFCSTQTYRRVIRRVAARKSSPCNACRAIAFAAQGQASKDPISAYQCR